MGSKVHMHKIYFHLVGVKLGNFIFFYSTSQTRHLKLYSKKNYNRLYFGLCNNVSKGSKVVDQGQRSHM